MDPDFKTQSAWMTNVQLERAIANTMSLAVGFVNSMGRNLPVLIDTTSFPPGRRSATAGRSTRPAVNASTRVNPLFNHMDTFQSIGESTYNAFTLTWSKRMSHGFQAQATYTFAKGEDNAPLTGTYVVGSNDDRVSDFSNLDRDKGVTPFNQAHTFVISTVSRRPSRWTGWASTSPTTTSLASSCVAQRRSAVQHPLEPRSQPGRRAQRPAARDRPEHGTPWTGEQHRPARTRASSRCPARSGANSSSEVKNLFNNENVSGVNRVVAVDTAGIPMTTLPEVDAFPATAGYDQRTTQLGLKFLF